MASDSSKRSWPLLATAFLAAALFSFQAPVYETPDSASYLTPARSWASGEGLLQGNGTPLSYRTPPFPLALGVTLWAFGDWQSHAPIGAMNLSLLILAALAIRRAIFVQAGRRAADLAAAVTVLYPPLLTSTAVVLQEVMLALLVSLVFWSVTRALTQPGVAPAALAGLSLGLATLGKPTVLAAAPFLLLLFALTGGERAKRSAGFVIAALLAVAPWAVRNRVLLGHFEIAPGNGGHTLLGGTVSNEIDAWDGFPEYQAALNEWNSGASTDASVDTYLARVAVRRILANPLRFAALCAERVGRFMLPARTWFVQAGLSRTGTFSPGYLVAIAINMALFALTAFVGVLAFRTRDGALAVGPILVFAHMGAYAITYVSPRYALTVTPVLIACATLAVRPFLRRP